MTQQYSDDFLSLRRAIHWNFIAKGAPIREEDLTPEICRQLINDIGDDYLHNNRRGILHLPGSPQRVKITNTGFSITTGGKKGVGVILKHLVTHSDQRGFFREVIRSTDDFFAEGFGQWSHSVKHEDISEWHAHSFQVDWWYVPIGVMKAVLCDLRPYLPPGLGTKPATEIYKDIQGDFECQEFLLGEDYPPGVLRIPAGVAHGFKVLKAPVHLFYITSQVYNPADEGRIAFSALGYDWHK